MLTTTLREIRKHSPCRSGWEKLTTVLGPDWSHDAEIPLARIVETNGLDDALWALRACGPEADRDRIARQFACWCVRQVWHLLTDERSRHAVEVSERFAVGEATPEDLVAARVAAGEAAGEAAVEASWAASWAASWDAPWDAARNAASNAARVAASDAASDAARNAASDAAMVAARVAAGDAQKAKLLEMLA